MKGRKRPEGRELHGSLGEEGELDEEGAHRGRPKAELTKEARGYGICSRIWAVRRALLSL